MDCVCEPFLIIICFIYTIFNEVGYLGQPCNPLPSSNFCLLKYIAFDFHLWQSYGVLLITFLTFKSFPKLAKRQMKIKCE